MCFHVRKWNFWKKLTLINVFRVCQWLQPELLLQTPSCKIQSSVYGGPFEVTAASGIPPTLQKLFKIPYLEERTQACIFKMSVRFFWALPQSAFVFTLTLRDVGFRVVQRWGSWLRGRTCLAEEFLQWNLHKTYEISREIFRDASKPTLRSMRERSVEISAWTNIPYVSKYLYLKTWCNWHK